MHINAAVAGLVGAMVLGKRIGYGKESMALHSLTLTMVGASMLWVGWFGFNAGSNLESTAGATWAFINALFATAAAVLSWWMAESVIKGKARCWAPRPVRLPVWWRSPWPPAAALVGAIVLSLISGVVCLWGVTGLKRGMLGVDDSLDVFGVHGVGGILGAVLTGVFSRAPSLGRAPVATTSRSPPGHHPGSRAW